MNGMLTATYAMHAIVERLRQHTAGQKLPPPVSEASLVEAERHFGFRLPDLLREIYGTVADGGFGPTCGLLPLLTPEEEAGLPYVDGDSVAHLYTVFVCEAQLKSATTPTDQFSTRLSTKCPQAATRFCREHQSSHMPSCPASFGQRLGAKVYARR